MSETRYVTQQDRFPLWKALFDLRCGDETPLLKAAYRRCEREAKFLGLPALAVYKASLYRHADIEEGHLR